MRLDELRINGNSPSGGQPPAAVLPKIRICVLGSPGVGKTAVMVRYLTRRFIHEYSSGKDLLYSKTVRIDGSPCGLEIADTSNPAGAADESSTFPSVHVKWADACIVVYSIRDPSSFRAAAGLLDAVHQLKSPFYLPVLLVGNQKDLEHSRQVRPEDGQALAVSFNCHFVEVSAAQGGDEDGISLSMTALFREVRTLKAQRTAAVRYHGGGRRARPALMNVSRLFSSLIGRGHGQQQVETGDTGSPSSPVKKRPSFSL